MTQPRLGVTLYSFTPEFHARRYDVWDLIRIAGERGLGPGLEVVGFQSIRDFPSLSREWVNRFRAAVESAGLELSCLGANADALLRRDRSLTEDELTEYMRLQLEAAARLGFPVVRVQYSVTPDLIERLLPHAERLNVKMGMEVHSPHSVHHPVIRALWERYEKLGSPYAGFIPDWGASMECVPPSILEAYGRRGVPAELLDAVAEEWQHTQLVMSDAQNAETRRHFADMVQRLGGGDAASGLAHSVGGLFGHQEPEDWSLIMPHVVHVHGKFYDIDAAGNSPGVMHGTLLRGLVGGGYRGFISSEWEGWHWNRESDPFDMVGAHHRLCRRIMADLEAEPERAAGG